MSSESSRSALLDTWTETSSIMFDSMMAANRAAFAAFGLDHPEADDDGAGATRAELSRRPGRERGRDDGKFGRYGGQYVPEALMPAIEELTDAYERYVLGNEDGFMDEFRERLADFGGRPTPLQRADRLSERYDTEV